MAQLRGEEESTAALRAMMPRHCSPLVSFFTKCCSCKRRAHAQPPTSARIPLAPLLLLLLPPSLSLTTPYHPSPPPHRASPRLPSPPRVPRPQVCNHPKSIALGIDRDRAAAAAKHKSAAGSEFIKLPPMDSAHLPPEARQKEATLRALRGESLISASGKLALLDRLLQRCKKEASR